LPTAFGAVALNTRLRGGDQDMPRPLLALFTDGLSADLIEIKGVFPKIRRIAPVASSAGSLATDGIGSRG
jgi:hypothetical protein